MIAPVAARDLSQIRECFVDIDRRIRAGLVGEAAQVIQKVLRERGDRIRKDRDLNFELAALARRARLPLVSLRLLNRFVRPESAKAQAGRANESIEYAAALVRLGAADEALQLLSTLSPQEYPETLVQRATALFSQWNYADAIPLLERYVADSRVEDYSKLVGEMNLAAAWVHEGESKKAQALLETLIEQTEPQSFALLHSAALELSGENALALGDWRAAELFLDRAAARVADSQSLEALFLRKWRCVLELKRDGPGSKAFESLAGISQEAKRRGHWETVRDCDFHRAILGQERALVRHLFFGTRFKSYRKRLLSLARAFMNVDIELKAPFDLLAPGSELSDQVFDLERARLFSGSQMQAALKPGQLPHRLLWAMSLDFYRPFGLVTLHELVFPGRYYNPSSSASLMHQAIKRLRSELRRLSIPIEVVEEAGFYRLEMQGGVALRIYDRKYESAPQRIDVLLESLRAEFGAGDFTAAQAAKALNRARRSITRYLSDALAESKVELLSTTRPAHYRVAPKKH